MRQQHQLPRKDPSQRPVKVIYIIGSGRSGSTVLDMALGSFPGIVSTGELANLFLKTAVDQEYCSCGTLLARCPFWGKVLADLREQGDFSRKRYAELQQHFERLRGIPRLLLPHIEHNPDFQWYLKSSALIIRTALNAAGADVLIDSSKSPARALALSYSPEIDIVPVHLVADPRSVVWSLQRAWTVDPKAGIQHPIAAISTLAATAKWFATNLASERIKRHLQNTLFLRYEDFAADPVPALDNILKTVGVRSAEHLFSGEITTDALHLPAGNRVRRQRKVTIRRDRAWERGMTPARKRIVRLVASPLMRKYGYPHSPKSACHRIMLVIYSLGRGGAERVITELANHWTQAGHAVVLLTFAPDPTSIFPLDQKIERIVLPVAGNSTNALQATIRNIRVLRRLRDTFKTQAPDVILSFMTRANVLTLLAAHGLDFRTIISDRVDPRRAPIPLVWRLLRRVSYALADLIVVQTESLRSSFAEIAPTWRCATIPNPLSRSFEHESDETRDIRRDLGLARDSKILIGIGRLVPQKGFDLLIRAFAACHARHPDWHLVIIGEGRDRDKLQKLSRDYGINARTHLPGLVQSPRQFLQQADLYVLSSRYEGFPNALLEAMSCGIPVVSFKCPSGPEEIIKDGTDGILVENGDITGLSKALAELMGSDIQRSILGSTAQRNVQRYSPAVVLPLWDKILESAD